MSIAIKADHLSKTYRLGGSRAGSLRELFGSGIGFRKSGAEFKALNDVSFEVNAGETIGIIGKNGAGKSTLLKILSRITMPDKGRVEINGRLAALLEVGTGFHPELNGKENIFLNGTILGLSRKEIRKKLDEIIAFSGIERFLYTPVKHYSSGMYVRLAFSVAAHLEPEILVVDEVLAVGDAEFQKKCLGKMDSVMKSGRTVLFVSHNMSIVQSLCSKAYLLESGRIVASGNTAQVISRYAGSYVETHSFERSPMIEQKATITQGRLINSEGQFNNEIMVEMNIDAAMDQQISIDVRLTDPNKQPVAFGSLGTFNAAQLASLKKGKNKVGFRIDTSRLATGNYSMSIDLTVPDIEFIDKAEEVLQFEIIRSPINGDIRVLSLDWGRGAYQLPVELIRL